MGCGWCPDLLGLWGACNVLFVAGERRGARPEGVGLPAPWWPSPSIFLIGLSCARLRCMAARGCWLCVDVCGVSPVGKGRLVWVCGVRVILENSTVCQIVDELVCYALSPFG